MLRPFGRFTHSILTVSARLSNLRGTSRRRPTQKAKDPFNTFVPDRILAPGNPLPYVSEMLPPEMVLVKPASPPALWEMQREV
jgi:hypothetical protein